ncbi:MAG: M48 family metallopeptidase [Muribaculaceae bacterium]|nr:M48 family metallopeptidase [Muribaculaceae bacterium]
MVIGEMTHDTLGRVVVTMRRNSSHASARWRGGAVSLNVPFGIRGSQIGPILDDLAPRLLATRPEVSYTEGQVLSFPGISIEIRRQRLAPSRVLGRAAFPVSSVEVGTELSFDLERTTSAVSDMLLKIARRVAPQVLLPDARACAERVGKRPVAWTISTGHRVLGVCDSRGTIALSYVLVFLPAELREYVICHELAHLSEMNHSPRFHALLDSYLGGREELLTARLKDYRWPVYRR